MLTVQTKILGEKHYETTISSCFPPKFLSSVPFLALWGAPSGVVMFHAKRWGYEVSSIQRTTRLPFSNFGCLFCQKKNALQPKIIPPFSWHVEFAVFFFKTKIFPQFFPCDIFLLNFLSTLQGIAGALCASWAGPEVYSS